MFARNRLAHVIIAAVASGLGSQSLLAQEATTDESDSLSLEEVEVTGYRDALLNSTAAKRNSVGFKDEVFADDMGKMPSQNLAESLAQIPGVKISREVSGEGQRIAVRGLGPAFTKIALNGNSIGIASMGNLNQSGNGGQLAGREVDLDIFPTELFGSLTVEKTATARQLEGGVTGYVNMRTMRASDLGDGHNTRFALESDYRASNGETSPKGAFTYSFNNDQFGALVTVVNKDANRHVDGYETVGNNAQFGCLITDQPDSVDCRDSDTSATFRFTDVASADYAAAHDGVSEGDTIDIYQSAGLSEDELNSAGMPYIGRVMTTQGQKESLSSLLSFQYRPHDRMEASLDIVHADTEADFVRTEVMHFYRRNYDTPYIPENFQLVDNGNGNRLRSGTFYGNRAWVGSRDYDEDLSYLSIMPSVDWQISDAWKLNVSASKSDSEFERDNPYGLFFTGEGTMTFADDGDVPTVEHTGFDNYQDYMMADSGYFRVGHEDRETETRGFHAQLEWGEDADVNGVIFGIASDEISSRHRFYDIPTDLDEYLTANGADNVKAALGDYITPIDMGENIDNYNGFDRVGDLDWNAFKKAVNYAGMNLQPNDITEISEEVTAFFVETNLETEVAGRPLRANGGVRYVDTDQYVATDTGATNEDYTKILPSLSAVLDATDSIKLRVSSSRSLTRANPADMFPNSAWAGSGIDSVNTGNPNLQPFESSNFDIGGEWYFNELGYVGLTYFTKDVTGFTATSTIPVNFEDLDEWGIDTSDLSQTQEDQLSLCSPDCIVTVETTENINGATEVDGWEAVWVQPLEFLLPGLGFNTSVTFIDAVNENGDEISGVSDSYSGTAYYENDIVQVRLTYYHQEGAHQFDSWGAPVTGRDRSQLDLSASYRLPFLPDNDLSITFDAYNLTNEKISSYMELDNSQTFNSYSPGAMYTLGIRGSF
ncbi:TonB-dependent receptor [Microbulbifer halophilus]|uniref:TonB-dependent receptor n=1 Tax=Microbulbifer halophilus TaxID=453963 RepID=A0ABW5ECM8_9GAMM|nr:TonB-dependent receptor [Microbulbifer halophilus]MCW8126591.1 TonB-dependent receptor [Microbulbifer halophilus]